MSWFRSGDGKAGSTTGVKWSAAREASRKSRRSSRGTCRFSSVDGTVHTPWIARWWKLSPPGCTRLENMPGRNNGLLWMVAFALLAILVWGLEQVAVAPLETGEVYPAYSSLRSDPLGAKALYESLAALPDLTVERL